MKKYASFYALIVFFAVTSCAKKSEKDTLQTTYVHPYGVEMPNKAEWSARGETGEVIHKKTNGSTVTELYQNGALQGMTSYTFPNSDIIEKLELYEQGSLVCEITHYPSGLPLQKKVMKGPSQFSSIVWYEDGSPRAEEDYKNTHLCNGKYFSLNNELESEVVNGSGIRTLRNGLGDLVAKEVVVNGERVLQETYYSSGMPKTITSYFAGKIQGQRKFFYPAGDPERVEEWNKGEQTGITKVYQNGACIAHIPYEKGRKHGTEIVFKDGVEVEEISWENNRRHGPTNFIADEDRKTDWYFLDEKVPKSKYLELLHATPH